MDSQHNPHDATESGLRLAPNVTTVMAEDLRAALVLAADHDEEIRVDATDTVSIGQAALQLLVAAKLEADRLGMPFLIDHAQPALTQRIAALGLAETLGLAVGEELHR